MLNYSHVLYSLLQWAISSGKPERGHAGNAGNAAFVTRILLASLHEFRACRTITQKGSGGILCEAMTEVVGFLASGFDLTSLFRCALTQLT